MKAIKIESLIKKYKLKGAKEIEILNDVSYSFESGKIYNIVGHSGAGKTTFLNIIGTLMDFDSGKIFINNVNISKISAKEKALMRNKNIGFVFQNYLLDENLKAYENVMIPMYINHDLKIKDRKKIAIELLNKVGLIDRINHFPRKLSGGEQQRVSIARALANDPQVILADEPTGNLDKKNELKIMKIFQELKKEGKCVIIASHSDYIKEYADVVLEINNGRLKKVK